MDINRQQSVGLIIIRPKNPQSDRKTDRLTMFRPKTGRTVMKIYNMDISPKTKTNKICY